MFSTNTKRCILSLGELTDGKLMKVIISADMTSLASLYSQTRDSIRDVSLFTIMAKI